MYTMCIEHACQLTKDSFFAMLPIRLPCFATTQNMLLEDI